MLPNIVLFAGINSANSAFGLWETDGTATGTFELTTPGKSRFPGRLRSMAKRLTDSCPTLRGIWT